MAGVRVGHGARVQHAIIQNGSEILDHASIGFDSSDDSSQYRISRGGIMVVEAGRCSARSRLAVA